MFRVMAIDYGEKRIGIALTDPLKIISKPFCVLENKGKKQFIEDLEDLIKKQNVGDIVLGYPLGHDGQQTKKTLEVLKIHEYLNKHLDQEVKLQDERFTTVEANEELKKMGYNYMEAKKVIDMVAAYMILKSYVQEKY